MCWGVVPGSQLVGQQQFMASPAAAHAQPMLLRLDTHKGRQHCGPHCGQQQQPQPRCTHAQDDGPAKGHSSDIGDAQVAGHECKVDKLQGRGRQGEGGASAVVMQQNVC